MSETPCSPPKKRGKFLGSWKINRPWLRYDSTQNLMFCDICIRAQVINVFTTGCDTFKKDTFLGSIKITSCNIHQLHYRTFFEILQSSAIAKATQATTISTAMVRARETALSKNKIAIISSMKNVYFAARNNMPNCLIPKLHELCIDQVIIIVNFWQIIHNLYFRSMLSL